MSTLTFLFLLLSYFSRCFLATLDPVFDGVAEEEGGAEPEDFEDQANQGKQPLDHDYDTPLYACHF